ncbi:MAG: isopenicillin N synthase family oxygenase [Alphaproteobacteria bacterium]|nr:isopenicillin N synthase family oxygenase [Alphaproteobacteria bacterium]
MTVAFGLKERTAAGIGAQRVPFDSVPVIDLGPLRSGDPAGKRRTADAIGRACEEIGFIYIANHGVPQDLIDHTFAEAKRFFALPLAAKMKIPLKDSANYRGYFPLKEEKTDVTAMGDLKEGFDLMRELGPDDPDVRAGKPLHGPNQWPDDLPGFRASILGYYAAMEELAKTLLRGMALSLDLDENWFADKTKKPLAYLRLLHYPPQKGMIDEREIGCGAHSDYGCLTILAQDQVGGLQLRNSAGQWIEAPPIPGAFVINLGDQMARWTNERFQATPHRVINRSGKERYSIPFFFDPDFDAVIECLPSCQGPGNPPKHKPITGGEHLLGMLNATFK